MSRLDDLLNELCPDGVEYKELKDCVYKTQNVKWKTEERVFQYIDLTSVDRNTHRIVETSTISKDNAPSRAQQIVQKGDVLFGGTRPMLKRYCIVNKEYDGQICSTGFCVLRANEDIILSRWLYHIISSTDFYVHVEKYQKGASYPAITDAEVKMYRLPVPPLEVQREIVRVLDSFTLLTDELTEKLEEENLARRKQYEYYNKQIMAGNISTKSIVLKDIADVTVGIAISATHAYSDNGVVMFRNQNIKRNILDDSEVIYISEEFSEQNKGKKLRENDILVTRTGYPGQACIVPKQYEGAQTFTTLIVRVTDLSVSPEYVCRYINSIEGQEYVNKMKTGAAQQNFGAKALELLPINVPSLSAQHRLVDALKKMDDVFEKSILTLLEEIEKRKKQYEYYRDRLLTFREK